MMSAAELARIQADAQAAACDQACAIYRATSPTTDAYSSPTNVMYQLIETTVAGVAEPTANQLQNYDFMIGSLAAWHVKLPVGTGVLPHDHLVIGGQTLEVQVVLTPRSYPALESVLASEVK